MTEFFRGGRLRRRDVFSQHGGASRTRRTATGRTAIAPAV
jgi:hypothetical protein